MIITIIFGNILQDLDLTFGRVDLVREDIAEALATLHIRLLEHSVGAHIEEIAGLNIGSMIDISLGAIIGMRLHGSSYHILLRGMASLFAGQFSDFDKIIDQRMVFGFEQDTGIHAILAGADMIDAAIADMGDSGAIAVKAEEGHGGAHLLLGAIILEVESIESGSERPLQHVIAEDILSLTLLILGDILPHGLAHGGTRHLAGIMATHAVAQDKSTIRILQIGGQGICAILLMGIALGILALTKFPNAIYFNFVFHIFYDLERISESAFIFRARFRNRCHPHSGSRSGDRHPAI